jgi:hypothetical protein
MDTLTAALASSDRPDDEKRFGPGGNRVGQSGVWRFVRQILLAGEKAQERSALLGYLVADGSAQHWVLGLQGIQDGTLRRPSLKIERYFGANAG